MEHKHQPPGAIPNPTGQLTGDEITALREVLREAEEHR